MSFRRFLVISAASVCGTIGSLWAQDATTATAREYVFPPVGLGSSETASITVVNKATAAGASPGTSVAAVAAPSCTGTISFANANGAIGTPASFTVGSQQFKTVTLPFASAGLTGIRGEIQGSFTLTTSTAAPCSLMSSLETYDSGTGATHAVLSASLANVGPVGPILPLGSR